MKKYLQPDEEISFCRVDKKGSDDHTRGGGGGANIPPPHPVQVGLIGFFYIFMGKTNEKL